MKTIYNTEENGLIEATIRDIKSGKYISKNVDLLSSKARSNYSRFISEVCKKNPKEYFTSDFKKINSEEFMEIFNYIIYTIFKDNKNVLATLKEFNSSLIISNTDQILNGACLTYMDLDTGKLLHIVEVPSIDNISSIISVLHEFIHFYTKKYNIDLNKKLYYEEILSLYAEEIAVEIISKYTKTPDFEHKIMSTRLENIRWHYHTDPESIKDMYKVCEYLRSPKNNSIDLGSQSIIRLFDDEQRNNFKNEFFAAYPWIKTKEGRKNRQIYHDFLAQSYGIGQIYADGLYFRHLDSSKFDDSVSSLFSGKVSLQELLDSNNINCSNEELIDKSIEKVKTL